jgi:hypothetical protein
MFEIALRLRTERVRRGHSKYCLEFKEKKPSLISLIQIEKFNKKGRSNSVRFGFGKQK